MEQSKSTILQFKIVHEQNSSTEHSQVKHISQSLCFSYITSEF